MSKKEPKPADELTTADMFSKIMELQQEVAKLRQEKRSPEEKIYETEELERRCKDWERKYHRANDLFNVAEAKLEEMARVRDAMVSIGKAIACLTEERKGDGWDAWRRRGA